MEALIVIDAQNEFSLAGRRPVPNYSAAIEAITRRVAQARRDGRPIAWVRHHNLPNESPAFQPGTWGAEFCSGMGPSPARSLEVEFQKSVYGAFTGTEIGQWLKDVDAGAVMLVGFYTHGCVATTAREAIMRDLQVSIDADATGACDMQHDDLGRQTAEEVRRSSLLHLAWMGVQITPFNGESSYEQGIKTLTLMQGKYIK